ncbi:hypothetical protein [Akkermansia massiliensis]
MKHAAAPAPPHRGLLIKSAGLLVAISPLCAWNYWNSIPSAALLAPLLLASLFAGTAWAMNKNVRETFHPVLPAVRLTLAAGLAFTLITLFSQAALNWLPQVLAGTAVMPPAWIIPLGHLNLLVTFCALLLLTMAAAYACLLCTVKLGIRPAAGKRGRTPEPGLPAESR